MKKLRVVIVGFGFMGKTHALNVQKSSQMELAAIVDPNMGTAGAAGGNFETAGLTPEEMERIPRYGSAAECFRKEALDAAFICVHTQYHHALALEALSRGLHVFVEKPFVMVRAQGEELIAEAKKRGLQLGVGHVVRFMPAYEKLYEMVQSQTFGRLQFISLNRFTGVPDWGEWEKRRQEFGSSGGALFDLVIHDIDYLHYLLGVPDEVQCTCLGGKLSRHDYVSAFWRYANRDIQVKVEGGNIFHCRFPFSAGYKASFEHATVIWDSANGGEIRIAGDTDIETINIGDANEGFRAETEYFASCVLSGTNMSKCNAESALETIRLCHAHATVAQL